MVGAMGRSKNFGLILASAFVGLLSACQPATDSNQASAAASERKTVHPVWPKLDITIKPDPAVEARVKEILDGMTLPQKVAQVIQPEIRDISVEDMREYGFGSYLNGGGAYPDNNKHARVADWVAHAEAMYQASIDDSIDGSTIPTMWGTDAVHGHNNVIGATLFPHNIGLGAANDPDLIKRIAAVTSVEVQATGIDWIFAPTVAAARDDRWGRTYESYSEDPDIIKAYSKAIVEGLQGDPEIGFFSDDKVIATVKHFIGDGGTQKGDDQGNTTIDEAGLFNIHGQGYVGGLSAGAQTAMASFNSWQGNKIHGHYYLLTQVLKEQMGFDGFVVGDWNGHGQIPGCSNDDCPQAMNAGLDVYMVPTQAWKPLYYNVLDQVESGEIPLSRLDDAVSRVLRVKIRAGIFDKPSPAKRPHANNQDMMGATVHREVAREAVRKSLVLLKNNNGILPLSPKQHILVAGDGAHNIGKQSGGWTITWQGTGNSNDDFPGGTSIYQGIQQAVSAAGGSVELSENGDYRQRPDVAIVVYGEEPYAEGNGDLDNLTYQRGNKTDLALLQKLKAQNIPIVSLFISGRPLWVNPELNASEAFVAVWLPGSEGEGVADVIFTDADGQIQHDFTGRLSFSWPANPDQHFNRHDQGTAPLFAYGYGLDYQRANANLTSLQERVDAEQSLPAIKALYQGTAKAPWRLQVVADNTSQTMTTNTLATEAIAMRTYDRRIQEDALDINWKDKAAVGLFGSFPYDFMGFLEAGAYLRFDIKIAELKSTLQLKLVCMNQCDNQIDLSGLLQPVEPGQWVSVELPLSCLAKQGVAFNKIMSPFALHGNAGNKIQLSDVVLALEGSEQPTLTPAVCAGE